MGAASNVSLKMNLITLVIWTGVLLVGAYFIHPILQELYNGMPLVIL